MTTVSTDRLKAMLVSGALAYVPPGGVAISASASRIYRESPALNATYPYLYFSLKSPQILDGFQQLKLVYHFEGFVLNRPRSTQPETETLADTWASYLRQLRDTSNGLVYTSDVVAESLPPFSSPADTNVVQVRVTGKIITFPAFISSQST